MSKLSIKNLPMCTDLNLAGLRSVRGGQSAKQSLHSGAGRNRVAHEQRVPAEMLSEEIEKWNNLWKIWAKCSGRTMLPGRLDERCR